MTTVDLSLVPAEPICHVANGDPCKFAGVCTARRQRIASAIVRKDGFDVVLKELVATGEDCPHYQHLEEQEQRKSGAGAHLKGAAFSTPVPDPPGAPA